MQNSLKDNSIQITAALDALTEGNLNPRARYNAMWYLSETERSAWTAKNLQDGCGIVAKLESDKGVGQATKDRVREAYDLVGPCP